MKYKLLRIYSFFFLSVSKFDLFGKISGAIRDQTLKKLYT